MNPRSFCREEGFPRCIALSYSFDPLFFERIILRDLQYGVTGDITVVADRGILQDAVSRYEGQFNYLGTRYLLTYADTRGIFHPKLILRTGPKGAQLLIGSGNLTFGGWGGNRELGVHLTLNADQPESAAIANDLLGSIEPYLSSDMAREALARLKDYSWLGVGETEHDRSIHITKPEEPLSRSLEERWAGRRFEKLTVFTGSTDEKGAFIRWCHDQFGLEECVVAVTPDNASFLKQEIETNPVQITLAPFTGDQMLHAKFYWFEGPDGPAAIVGSANCSRAAWLLAPADGGNVEAFLVYDNPTPEDFQDVLSALPESRNPVERTTPRDIEDAGESQADVYPIESIVLKRSLEYVEVTLSKAVPAGSQVSLHGPNQLSLPLNPKSQNEWWSNLTETTPWPEGSTLAHVEFETDGQRFISPLHWVDDIDALTRASQARQVMKSFGGMTRSKTNTEHAQVVSDLAMISSALFTEKEVYNDPPLRPKPEKGPDEEKPPADPVKPENLIRSLNELEIQEPGLPGTSGPGTHLSIIGVMRALYEELDSQDPDLEPEDEAEFEEDPEEDFEKKPPAGSPSKPPRTPHREPPPEKYRQKLRDDLERFFANFSNRSFAEECTATKLVQAAAFPLALALIGERGKWLNSDESRAIVTRTVDILLNHRRNSKAEETGLLEEVGKRYKDEGRYEVFLQVVGDGTLWVATLTALAQLSWPSSYEKFERALSLHRVYNCTELRSDTSVGKLGALVSRVQIERARELLVEEAPRCAEAIETIEALLGPNYQSLLEYQSTKEHQVDDIIWNPDVGWGRVIKKPSAGRMMIYLHMWGESRKVVAEGFYLSIRDASTKHPSIGAEAKKIGISI